MDTANDFFDKLFTGADLHKYSPILHLRNFLMKKQEGFKISYEMRYAMTVKGWNYHRQGQDMKRIWIWRTDEKMPEPY